MTQKWETPKLHYTVELYTDKDGRWFAEVRIPSSLTGGTHTGWTATTDDCYEALRLASVKLHDMRTVPSR